MTNAAPVEDGNTPNTGGADSSASPFDSLKRAYAAGSEDDLPLGGYAFMMGVYATAFGSLTLAAARAGKLPLRISSRDVALLGVATHKLTQIISRERITMPLRAPFTQYEGKDGAGLVREHARGPGLRRAIGNLLVCQFCTGPWVATLLGAGLVFAPRPTRLASSVFAMVTVSDFLHQAYAAARRWSR